MVQKGTYVVPTIGAGEFVENAAKSGRLTGLRAEKALAAAQGLRNSVRLAHRIGVPIALGTDAGVGEHGTNGHEFTLLVTWGGLTPMQAITAGATSAPQPPGGGEKDGTPPPGKRGGGGGRPREPPRGETGMGGAEFLRKRGG